MPTIVIRGLPAALVAGLKRLARHHHRSMEQEARVILQERVTDRLAVLAQVERAWSAQIRSPSSGDVDAWLRGQDV
jgi:plasmid stability protein